MCKSLFQAFRIFVRLKKVTSISLIFMLLLGNLGITFGTHFCGGRAIVSELMFGEKHLDCGMGMMDMPEAEHDSPHFSKSPCCENQYVSAEVDETLNKEVSNEAAQFFVAIAIATILYSIEFEETFDQPIPVDTSPQLGSPDYQALHQVFLI